MGMAALIAKLGVDISGWTRGWKQAHDIAQKGSSGIASGVKGKLAAMFGAAAIEEGIRRSIEYGSKIGDTSKELGVSATRIQQFGYAATQSGADMEDFTSAMIKAGKARQAALNDPAGKEMSAFKKFGIEARELKTMGIDDLLLKISDSFAKAANPQEMMAQAIAVLGKSSPKVFQAMREDLRGTMEEAKKLGLVMGDQTIASLKMLGDQLERLRLQTLVTFGGATMELLKAFRRELRGIDIAAGMAHTFSALRAAGATMPMAAAGAWATRNKMSQDFIKQDWAETVKSHAEKTTPFVPNFEADAAGNKVSGFKSNPSAWQQIGAFSFMNPMLTEQKRTNQILEKVDTHVKTLGKMSAPGLGEWNVWQ